ncbi:hypothetical protein GGX14DRAFT_607907 [Mycena pura]|uniref:Uncharacterized protein n=1 Tax=Mycena pura TaxID=153505 RepID=A0AAD6USW6_9AGAR|nr:hypothetical protein GGX14DRAFT_607907 [Mycena pura]
MPVTFSPAQHPATSENVPPVTSAQILERACPNRFQQVDQIIQYSIGGRSGSSNTLHKIVPNKNGFVNTVMSAYSHHHALVIRPDDVWLAIISQFSLYVNTNAEFQRTTFVAHEGRRELEIVGGLPADFIEFSQQMGELIQKNVADPGLREWIVPDFSTTTTCDTTVGAMLMMATMKNYFNHKMKLMCGIPRVTLEGDRHDWELVLHRLEKLKEYGLPAIAWYHLLHPVISQFVMAFEEPNSPQNLDFWRKVASQKPFGSGDSHWSGWITAFCVFSATGKWLGPQLDTSPAGSDPPEVLPSHVFWSTYTRQLQTSRLYLALDGTEYPVIDSENLTAGYAEVDITVNNNNGAEFPYVVVAGLVGMGFSSSRDTALSPSGTNDTVRPVVGWWMYSKLSEAEQKRRYEQAWVRPEHPPTLPAPPMELREQKVSAPLPPPLVPKPPWRADQSQGLLRSGTPPARAVGSTTLHNKRKSESAAPKAPANSEPSQRRRFSLLKLACKY